MPWHSVQFLRITCHTGPSGLVTCGRMGRPDSWADAGIAAIKPVAAHNLHMCALRQGKRRRAGTETLPIDPIKMEDDQEHVGSPLLIVRIHNMAIPFERSVDSSQQNYRHLHMRMPVRIAHVAALVDQHVIEYAAIAIRHVL